MQAALDLLADLMTSSRECLREGLELLVRLTFALEPQQEFKWRAQPEAIIRHVLTSAHADAETAQGTPGLSISVSEYDADRISSLLLSGFALGQVVMLELCNAANLHTCSHFATQDPT